MVAPTQDRSMAILRLIVPSWCCTLPGCAPMMPPRIVDLSRFGRHGRASRGGYFVAWDPCDPIVLCRECLAARDDAGGGCGWPPRTKCAVDA
jgi:hypothetical protein